MTAIESVGSTGSSSTATEVELAAPSAEPASAAAFDDGPAVTYALEFKGSTAGADCRASAANASDTRAAAAIAALRSSPLPPLAACVLLEARRTSSVSEKRFLRAFASAERDRDRDLCLRRLRLLRLRLRLRLGLLLRLLLRERDLRRRDDRLRSRDLDLDREREWERFLPGAELVLEDVIAAVAASTDAGSA